MRINFSFFVFAVLCAAAAVFVSPRPPSSVRCGSRGATAAVFQGIPFVPATSGVLVRVRLCACWYAILNTIWTLGILPLIFKSARAVHRHPNSYGTTSSEPHLGSYTYGIYEGTPVFPLFNLVARLYTTVQVWVQAGLRGACSGRSKLRNLASNHGIAFRRAIANQAHGKPTNYYAVGERMLL